MFDKVASLCPESIRITTTMSGQKFVKCLAPINLGALRNRLGLWEWTTLVSSKITC